MINDFSHNNDINMQILQKNYFEIEEGLVAPGINVDQW